MRDAISSPEPRRTTRPCPYKRGSFLPHAANCDRSPGLKPITKHNRVHDIVTRVATRCASIARQLLRRFVSAFTVITIALTLLVTSLAGCRVSSTPVPVLFPKYNQVYGIATHNSYWINRSDQQDFKASGTQEALLDQLLHDHVRSIELDIHSNNGIDGDWRVYHTSPSEDFSCWYLSTCLEMLRVFQYALPQHEVINVVIELKNSDPQRNASCTGLFNVCNNLHDVPTEHTFEAPGHTVEIFDALLRSELGDSLYTPGDFLSHCQGLTMVDCARTVGWPRIDQLRGKFIVNLDGNWSTAFADWVSYTTASGGIRNRVAFPIASIFGVFSDPNSQHANQYFTVTNRATQNPYQEEYFVYHGFGFLLLSYQWALPNPFPSSSDTLIAMDSSVFWQVEDIGDPADTTHPATQAARQFLLANGVIRGHDSYDYHPGCDYKFVVNGNSTSRSNDCQEGRISAGFQLIQTDYPWHFVHDAGPGIPTDPSQRLKDPSWLTGAPALPGAPYHEPGARLYFHVPWPPDKVYAYQDGLNYTGPALTQTAAVSPVSQRWIETTVSTTRNGGTWRIDPGAPSVVDSVASDYRLPCPYPAESKVSGERFMLDFTFYDPNNCSEFPTAAQPNGQGCIVAFSASGQDYIALCRQKNSGGGADGGGASYFQEAVRIFIFEVKNGGPVSAPVGLNPPYFSASRYSTCAGRPGLPNSDDTYAHPQCVGSMIAMSVVNNGAAGATVRLYSAGRLKSPPDDTPQWSLLATEHFDQPLVNQGLSANQDVLFVGTRTTTMEIFPNDNYDNPSIDPARLAILHANGIPNRSLNVNDDESAVMVDLSSCEVKEPCFWNTRPSHP